MDVYQLREEPYMARTTRPLTHTEVQKAKATDKDLTLHDGDGLFLLVKNYRQENLAFPLSASQQ